MKATDVIKRDHRAAEAIFKKFKKASEEERDEMAPKIFKALDTHEEMEDTYFYPELEEKMGDKKAFKELEKEQATLAKEVAKVKALKRNRNKRIIETLEKVLKHAKKEEREILSKAGKLLGSERLEELGEKMEPMSAVAQEEKS